MLRTLQPLHPQREIVRSAIKVLTAQGRELPIVPQNLVELWVVATRPVGQNGLGMTPGTVAAELARIKSMFLLLPETPGSSRDPAHDARLVAAMETHGLTAILTFDKSRFSRYPGIEVLGPEEVAIA